MTEDWEVSSSVLGEVSEESKSLKIGVRKSLLEKCPTQLETVTLLTRDWKNLILVTHLC